jgi:rubrerythrin
MSQLDPSVSLSPSAPLPSPTAAGAAAATASVTATTMTEAPLFNEADVPAPFRGKKCSYYKEKPTEQQSLDRLMGLAVFGEMVAARIYSLMAKLNPQFAELLKRFAQMEAHHASWFRDVCAKNGITPDKEFADGELGYLIAQVNDHFEAGDHDALAVVQGFIVESMAIAIYDPFLKLAGRYPGAREVFEKALDEEKYHVDWVTRYLRLGFFDAEDRFMDLTSRVNIQGIDCIGGTMMKIADYLDMIGLSGADCAGSMMDGYTELLERVGVAPKKAMKNVVTMFSPLMHKYRTGAHIK